MAVLSFLCSHPSYVVYVRKNQKCEAVGPQYLPVAVWVNVLARDSRAGKAELQEKSCCADAGFPLFRCLSAMPLAAAQLSTTCELDLQQQSSVPVLWSNDNFFFFQVPLRLD